MNKVGAVLILFGWLLVWELLSAFDIINAEIFVRPSLVLQQIYYSVASAEFYLRYLVPSLWRFMSALFIALPTAYALGLSLCWLPKIKKTLYPLLSALFPLPKVALFPLTLVVLGTGDSSKVALIALSMFFIVFFSIFHSTEKLLSGPYKDMIRSLQVPGSTFIYQILVKGTWLDFLISCRLALNYGITMIVVSEISMSNNGLGYYIWSSWEQLNMVQLYAGLFWIGLIGFMIGEAVDSLIALNKKYY